MGLWLKNLRLAANLSLIFLVVISLGQGCTGSNTLFKTENGNPINNLTASEAGNGSTYEGKLSFLNIQPGFKCEGQIAPKSMLFRNEEKKWFLTVNEKQKCASVSSQPVNDVNYTNGYTTFFYHSDEYNLDLKAPSISLGLPNYLQSFNVSALADVNSSDVTPGDGICANSLGQCSLKSALDEANATLNRPIVIELSPGVYKLTQTLETKANSIVVLHGSSAATTTLDGQNMALILLTSTGNGFGTTVINGLSLVNGKTANAFSGAAISNYGSLSLKNSIFTNNQSSNGAVYSGLYAFRGDLVVSNSRFDNNKGEGLTVFGAHSTTVSGSEFTNNIGNAGLFIQNGANNVVVKNSTFAYNASGGIYIFECHVKCEFENNTIAHNGAFGMGVNYSTTSPVTVFVKNSTIVHNGMSAANGQNIYFTLSGATALATLNISNSIIDSAGSGRSNCSFGGIASSNTFISNSILDDSSCFAGPSNIFASSNLSPLANNGGPTQTMMPLVGSPAIDAGDNLTCAQGPDQRGFSRPVNKLGGGAICDIGAVEVQ